MYIQGILSILYRRPSVVLTPDSVCKSFIDNFFNKIQIIVSRVAEDNEGSEKVIAASEKYSEQSRKPLKYTKKSVLIT